jgi:hypothetical protein
MAGKSNKTRDTVLIVAVLLLVALAFVPGKSDRSSQDASSSESHQVVTTIETDSDSESGDLITKAKKAVDKTNRYYSKMEAKVGSSEVQDRTPDSRDSETLYRRFPPANHTPHRYLPLIPGTKWVYWVSGDKDLVSDQKWTMEVITAPDENGHGVLEVGFEDQPARADVWLEKGSLKIDGVPFVEPEPFLGNRPQHVAGEFLPVADRLIDDAVWTQQYQREVIHDFYNKDGRLVKALGAVMQKDRALAGGLEKVRTHAGLFEAVRVTWISRVEMKVKGRPVLDKLTTEPYRKETMWLAPGYGIVRREIEYVGDETKSVIFNLMEYTRPGR